MENTINFSTYNDSVRQLSSLATSLYESIDCENTYLHVCDDNKDTFIKPIIKTPTYNNGLLYDICITGPAVEYELVNNIRNGASVYKSYTRAGFLTSTHSDAEKDPIIELISKEQFESELSNVQNILK